LVEAVILNDFRKAVPAQAWHCLWKEEKNWVSCFHTDAVTLVLHVNKHFYREFNASKQNNLWVLLYQKGYKG